MKRRGFLNLALLLPLTGSLKSILNEDELLHFDLSQLQPLLKSITPEDQVKANLLRKNLAFNVQYVLDRIKNLKDVEAIKSLAMEADRKFFAENKLAGRDFRYQTLNIRALEEFRNTTIAGPKEFDGMIRDIREQLTSLQGSRETYVREAVQKLAGTGAQKNQRTTAEEAKKAQECARTWTMVGAIVATVVAIVVAIVVCVFTFGSGSTTIMPIVSAIAGIAATASQVITVTNSNIRIDNTNISLKDVKVDLSKANLDSLLKCSTSAAAVTAAMSYFGKTAYPANPLVGSLTVSLIGIVAKLPGFNACS